MQTVFSAIICACLLSHPARGEWIEIDLNYSARIISAVSPREG